MYITKWEKNIISLLCKLVYLSVVSSNLFYDYTDSSHIPRQVWSEAPVLKNKRHHNGILGPEF